MGIYSILIWYCIKQTYPNSNRQIYERVEDIEKYLTI